MGLGHNGVVITSSALKLLDHRVRSQPGRDRESPDMVRPGGGDKIGQAQIGLIFRFEDLLAQEMKGGQRLAPRGVGVKRDVIAGGVGGEKAVDAAGRDELCA